MAIPLAERGVPVVGIELSQPMVDRLREKVSAEQVPVLIGDMATARADFVIELWVPGLRKLPVGTDATVWHTDPSGYIALDTYDVLQHG